MTPLRYLSIAVVLLSASQPGESAAEPLEGVRTAGRVSEPAGPGVVLGNGEVRMSPTSNIGQTPKRVEIGLALSNDAFANGFTDWDGVSFLGIDRVAERYALYGLPRKTPDLGFEDSALYTPCCQRSNTVTPLGRYAIAGAAPASPTISVFAILRKKGWDIDFKDGWKLQAGGRSREYSRSLSTKVGFLTLERFWESFRASYSFQVERSSGLNLAQTQVVLLDYLYSPGDSIGVSYAMGREFADFGAVGILNTEVRSVGIRGQHRFKKDWAFTYQAGHSDHGSLPSYQTARLGLQRSF